MLPGVRNGDIGAIADDGALDLRVMQRARPVQEGMTPDLRQKILKANAQLDKANKKRYEANRGADSAI